MERNTQLRELRVKGVGKISLKSDLIEITTSIVAKDPEYEKTINLAAEMLDSFRAALIKAGHKKEAIKTTCFRVDAEYERYDKDDYAKKRFIGFKCVHGLRLEFDIDMKMLGTTLEAISGCEADSDFRIKFTVKNRKEVAKKLQKSAIDDAKSKAEILADSSGVKLGVIQQIDYHWGEIFLYSSTDIFMDSGHCFRAPLSSIDVEPEDINLEDTATIVWNIE